MGSHTDAHLIPSVNDSPQYPQRQGSPRNAVEQIEVRDDNQLGGSTDDATESGLRDTEGTIQKVFLQKPIQGCDRHVQNLALIYTGNGNISGWNILVGDGSYRVDASIMCEGR